MQNPVEGCWEDEPQHRAATGADQSHKRGEVWDAEDNEPRHKYQRCAEDNLQKEGRADVRREEGGRRGGKERGERALRMRWL